MQQTIFGFLRVKNEARWITGVLESILPICERVFVLDDNSTDNTVELCEALPRVSVHRSPFETLDESRDKNWMLQKMFQAIPEEHQHFADGNPESPYWCLAIDGDEELAAGDGAVLQEAVRGPHHVHTPRILYLWDSADQVRVDGVYANFRRPSLFRLMNRSFTYKSTPWGNGANFHCSNIPQEMLHHSHPCEARLLHYGYMLRDDRIRKHAWYNSVDPGNEGEDCYRHCVQGDVPEIPAAARLKWAGPLDVRPLSA